MAYVIPVVLALLFLQQGSSDSGRIEQPRREAATAAEKHRQEAIRLNELAGHIKTEADAQELVNSIAKMFSDQLPSPWATWIARRRVARAEYQAVTDSRQLIPEDRIVAMWNQYVREISAPDEAILAASELHSLHDLDYATAKIYWSYDWGKNIWSMPDIYTVGPDNQLAHSCRVLEALRLLYDLDNRFENVRAARKALAEGKTFSGEIARLEQHQTTFKLTARVEADVRISDNPIRAAEYRYTKEHGSVAMDALLKRLLDQFLPD